MSPSTIEDFLSLLERSHLLTDEQMAAVRREVQHNDGALTPKTLARRLVDQNLLTRWHARRLLAGREAFFFGKYKLLDQLGQGGMGAVFKAEQAGLGRIVALKVMATQLLRDKGAVARFQREMQAAAALDHPHIVAAYDADCVKETHFLVMEYVNGRTLDDIVKKRGMLPFDEACEYIRQAALGLQHAHERGMVHRDIKPANLLVARGPDDEPLVKILDMGLARFSSELGEEGALTQTGQIMGTPDYIAPEQARNTKGADIRSDIFSLGCSLFRLLTGSVPFAGETVMQKLMTRSVQDAPRVRSIRPEVPPVLDAVIAKMLARNPADRYQTPSEVATALGPFAGQSVGGVSIPASPMPATTHATLGKADDHWERGPQIDAGLDRFLQQLATDVEEDRVLSEERETSRIGTAPTQTGAASQQATDPASNPVLQQGRVTLRKPGRNLRQHLITVSAVAIVGVLLLAAAIWIQSGKTALVIDLPEAERPSAAIEVDGVKRSLPERGTLRFEGNAGVRSVRLSRTGFAPIVEEFRMKRGETKTFRPTWRPLQETVRQDKIAELKRRVEQAHSRDPQSNETKSLRNEVIALARERYGTADALRAVEMLPRLAWPADGLRREDISAEELFSAGDGNPEAVAPEIVAILGDSRLKHWGALYHVAYTIDGGLATAGADRAIRLWDVATGSLRQTSTGAEGAFAIAPSGKWAAARNVQGSLTLWDLAAGTAHPFGEATLARPEALTFFPDESTLAAGMSDGEIVLWSVANREVRRRFASGAKRVSRLVIDSLGSRLAGFGDDLKVRVWNVADGTLLHDFSTGARRLKDLAFQPAGELLACAMWTPEEDGVGTARIWDVDTGNDVVTLPKFVACSSVAFSPDGRLLAAGSDGWDETGHVRCWEIDDWRLLWRRQLSGETAVFDLAFSPDGKTIAAAGEASRVHFLDAHSGEVRPRLESHHAAFVSSVAWSPDGEMLVSGSHDATAIVWDVASRTSRCTLAGHNFEVYAVKFSPDGHTIATSGRDGRVTLWDAETGELRRQMFGHKYRVGSLAFHPDGKSLVSGGWDDQTIFWDVEKGLELRRLPSEPKVSAVDLQFNHDGRMLAMCTSGTAAIVLLWDVKSMKRQQTWKGFGDSVFSVRFSPDGSRLTAAGPPIKRFDIKTGRETTLGGDRPSFLTLSRDGKRAALYRHGQLVIADPDLLDETLSVPTGFVKQAEFSPDGRHVATANANGTVYVIRLP